jgi:hypothetical protein
MSQPHYFYTGLFNVLILNNSGLPLNGPFNGIIYLDFCFSLHQCEALNAVGLLGFDAPTNHTLKAKK